MPSFFLWNYLQTLKLFFWTHGEDWQKRRNWLSRYFVFFADKKYSRSFIKLQLNHWCHMDYFNVLTTFLALEHISCVVGLKALWFHQKYLNLCSEDEWRSYGFGTTWGWVFNDRIFIFGRTIPLSKSRVVVHIFTSQAEVRWKSWE